MSSEVQCEHIVFTNKPRVEINAGLVIHPFMKSLINSSVCLHCMCVGFLNQSMFVH